MSTLKFLFSIIVLSFLTRYILFTIYEQNNTLLFDWNNFWFTLLVHHFPQTMIQTQSLKFKLLNKFSTLFTPIKVILSSLPFSRHRSSIFVDVSTILSVSAKVALTSRASSLFIRTSKIPSQPKMRNSSSLTSRSIMVTSGIHDTEFSGRFFFLKKNCKII